MVKTCKTNLNKQNLNIKYENEHKSRLKTIRTFGIITVQKAMRLTKRKTSGSKEDQHEQDL